MTKDNYSAEVDKITTIIDIAIDAIRQYPPKNFDTSHVNHFITTYTDFKNRVLSMDVKHRSIKGLAYIKYDALTYFQEGSGEAVAFFWSEIKQRNIGVNRVNKLEKILKKNKISTQVELDYVIDVMIPAQQEGLITKEQLNLLSSLIGKYKQQ